MNLKKCKIQIFGKVQGVAFRYYSKQRADELGLVGTAENQLDGSVITYICGDEKMVDLFIEWCHLGSPASKVDEVIISELPIVETREYLDFSILR